MQGNGEAPPGVGERKWMVVVVAAGVVVVGSTGGTKPGQVEPKLLYTTTMTPAQTDTMLATRCHCHG